VLGRRAIGLAAIVATTAAPAIPRSDTVRLLFTGDILLSRQVEVEMQRTRASPWAGLDGVFHDADWVAGNFEGAIGPATECIVRGTAPCFAAPPTSAALLAAAGFSAVTIENNHAGDLGPAGRTHSREELRRSGILGLGFDRSPEFMHAGNLTIALIAVTTVVAADGHVQAIPSTTLAQKLRMARTLADLVIVSVHWGLELYDWPTPAQRQEAEWLIDNGADLIVGHHPHVVQAPECVHGHPVFFSLGNHVFDQKYRETKSGLIADCRVADGRLRCGALRTQTRSGSSFPVLAGDEVAAISACTPEIHHPLSIDGVTLRGGAWSPADTTVGVSLEAWKSGKKQWATHRHDILSLQGGLTPVSPGGLLLSLELHPSAMDRTIAPRPYVYAVGERGLIARWRGTSLAWPLIDAVVDADGLLCALHRGDSFMQPDSTNTATRTGRYAWNGFGFSAAPAGLRSPCHGPWNGTSR
jgi:capsule synthesis protein PGA_cap